ncbi:hypothetical protein MNBD_GAMMA09-884 [hydrothermal vent metagenome]|uniref:Uncharacterized protein n=1 Tax=hydrothermal vent metagenome TaxID=652676 RepID=A0A3B0YQ84_9ZZZZ
MKLELTDEVMSRVGLSEQQIKEIIAVSLYQMEKINGVQGGKLIGTSEIEFHEVAGNLGQTFSYDENDLLDDVETLKKT